MHTKPVFILTLCAVLGNGVAVSAQVPEAGAAGRFAVLGEPLRHHANMVNTVALTKDGKRCVSSGWDNVAIVWSLDTDAAQIVLRGHTDPVVFAAFCLDDSRVVTIGDATIRVWDPSTGEEVAQRPVKKGYGGGAVSPDGKLLAGCPTGSIEVVRLDGLEVERTFSFGGFPASFDWSPDGAYLVVGDVVGGQLSVFDVRDGSTVGAHRFRNAPTSLRIRDDGKAIAVGAKDSIAIWPFPDLGEEPTTALSGPGTSVTGLEWWSPTELLFADANGGLQRLDLEAMELRWMVREHRESIASIALDRAKGRVVSGSRDRNVRFWNVEDGAELLLTAGNRDMVQALAWSKDGATVAAGDYGNTVCALDSAAGTVRARAVPHELSVFAVAVADDGTIVSIGQDSVIARTHPATGDVKERHTLAGVDELPPLFGAAIHGDLAACTFGNGELRFHAVADGALRASANVDEGAAYDVAFSPDGQRVVVFGASGKLRVFAIDGTSGVEIALDYELYSAPELCFAGNDVIAAGFDDGTVRLWSAADGALLHEHQPAEDESVLALAATADGRWLASCHGDAIRIWSVAEGKVDRSLDGFASLPTTAAFSPDGERLATGMSDSTTLVWGLSSP